MSAMRYPPLSDLEDSDNDLALIHLGRELFSGRGHLLDIASVLLHDLVELLDRAVDVVRAARFLPGCGAYLPH